MHVPVSRAKGRLTDLVRRADKGEEIVLTRFGRPAIRRAPVVARSDPAARRRLLEEVRARAAAKARRGPKAAGSHDFLYDRSGLPK